MASCGDPCGDGRPAKNDEAMGKDKKCNQITTYEAEGTGFSPSHFRKSQPCNDFGGNRSCVNDLASSRCCRSFPVVSRCGGAQPGQIRDKFAVDSDPTPGQPDNGCPRPMPWWYWSFLAIGMAHQSPEDYKCTLRVAGRPIASNATKKETCERRPWTTG